jgi:hypothetical protein
MICRLGAFDDCPPKRRKTIVCQECRIPDYEPSTRKAFLKEIGEASRGIVADYSFEKHDYETGGGDGDL